MNDKNITISVHEDDIRRLTLASLTFILGRHMSKYSNQVKEVEDLIENGTEKQTLESLQKLVNILEDSCIELSRVVPLVKEFDS
jgi:esterase/lipase superfamily enzyme